jgi:hypothetical protein
MAVMTIEDTKGYWHHHDSNFSHQTWECSKGHQFNCVGYNQCWCGWSSQYPNTLFHKDKPRKQIDFKFGKKAFFITNDKWLEYFNKQQGNE